MCGRDLGLGTTGTSALFLLVSLGSVVCLRRLLPPTRTGPPPTPESAFRKLWELDAVVTRVDAAVLWLRALAVASAFFFLGVAGHVTADGRLPGVPVLTAFFAVSVLLSVPMLTRPASTARVVVIVTVGQTMLHVLLGATAGHVGDAARAATTNLGTTAPGATGSLPLVDGRRLGSLQDAYAPAVGVEAPTPALPVGQLLDDVQADAPMMAAHLAVAVLVGLWLACGERALWTLVALAGRQVVPAVVVHPPVGLPARVVPLPAHRLPVRTTDHLTAPRSRRGPPLLAA
ncbi:hypothetical protein [Nocardioides sp.]|uniref:hypothetical protein n=1 Tax=Nocardioides sp. TaxID=35761 RepID=UPI00286BAE8B|nr:hypothetical protein [Nocardioides sp.]